MVWWGGGARARVCVSFACALVVLVPDRCARIAVVRPAFRTKSDERWGWAESSVSKAVVAAVRGPKSIPIAAPSLQTSFNGK